MGDLLVCLGEILVDFLPQGAEGEVTGFSLHPGGGPFNVAMGLARLGMPAAFVGKVGADYFGRRLRRAVRAEGIDDRWLLDAPAPTTLAFVAVEEGEPVFSFYGEGAADARLTRADLPDELFAQAGLLHFGGISLLRGSTPDAALAAAERLQGRALISLDPNIRPRLVRDGHTYSAVLGRAVATCDLLKLSAADVAWLAPGVDPAEYAAAQLETGPALVVLTRGAAGVTSLRHRDGKIERIDLPGFPVTVADTVGAGDTFSAGLLAALAAGGVLGRAALEALPPPDLRQALRQGAAASALACTRPGADPPRRAELEAFLVQNARVGYDQ
jgi:fructokinase